MEDDDHSCKPSQFEDENMEDIGDADEEVVEEDHSFIPELHQEETPAEGSKSPPYLHYNETSRPYLRYNKTFETEIARLRSPPGRGLRYDEENTVTEMKQIHLLVCMHYEDHPVTVW
ncbi:hypothetical protein HOY82DRAFT_535971 [Tuber indicum]|nr:hypothetical protein HOY82DRAFT_535971 [Tuber indicum]